MGKIKKVLLAEETRLKAILKTTKERLKNAPEGTLRLSSNKFGRMYYRLTDKKEYISKNNTDLISALAQKSYDKKIVKQAEKELEQLEHFLGEYKEELNQIYYEEHPDRRKYVVPIEPTWEQQLEEWKAKEYTGLGFKEDTPLILTEKGERVRSKSEKIIADYLYHNGIEYKYECPLYLDGHGIVYPDFTLLSQKSGKEIYFEHLGMMDDPKYARRNVRKIQTYEENGIFIGDQLIVTFETSQTVIGTKELDRLMKKYVTI